MGGWEYGAPPFQRYYGEATYVDSVCRSPVLNVLCVRLDRSSNTYFTRDHRSRSKSGSLWILMNLVRILVKCHLFCDITFSCTKHVVIYYMFSSADITDWYITYYEWVSHGDWSTHIYNTKDTHIAYDIWGVTFLYTSYLYSYAAAWRAIEFDFFPLPPLPAKNHETGMAYFVLILLYTPLCRLNSTSTSTRSNH